MKNCLYIILFTTALWLTGCGSNHALVKEKPLKATYNQEALDMVIDGTIANLVGMNKEALLKYHQAAEFDSSSPGIFLAMAENYYYLGEEKTSIKIINKVLNLDPENLDALILLAACYEKQNDYYRAMQVYKNIVKIEPGNLEHLYYLTSLQIVVKNYEQALASYQSMLQNGLDDPDFCLRIGYLFLQSRALLQAEQVYMGLYKQYPEEEEIYLALAATAKAKGDTLKAISWYKKALEYDDNFGDIRAELRTWYEKNQSWDEAINYFSSLLQKNPDNLANQLLLGNFYFEKGDTTGAITVFQNAIKSFPLRENSYLALASLLQMKKDTLAIEQLYTEALQKNSMFSTVRQGLKNLYLQRQEWKKAVDLYLPLQDNDSTYVSSRIEIANILMAQGDSLEAIDYFKPLMDTQSDDWRVPITLGRYYFLTGQHPLAAECFDKTLELRQDLTHLWILRGINYIQMDSLDLALDNFKTSLQDFPDDPGLNYYAGSILSRQRKFAQAIEYFEKSSEKEPDNIQSILALAGAFDELKEFDKSEPLYLKILSLSPESPVINNNYAYHLSVRGINLEKALEHSKIALQAEPDNGPYLDTMGWIYYKLGDYDQAIHYIEKSLAIDKDSPDVLEHLGDIYYKKGDQLNAEKNWKKSLELDGQRTHILEKLGQSKK
ncbi:MAG TPA: tetratricopeptide repeat protein [bacterium]|nr:tetratricopeptide repeat protein [bacterium]HPN42526.1 tetratricopeptide repeat protein [bacterium]